MKWKVVDVPQMNVPSCRECNAYLGNKPLIKLEDRWEHMRQYYARQAENLLESLRIIRGTHQVRYEQKIADMKKNRQSARQRQLSGLKQYKDYQV